MLQRAGPCSLSALAEATGHDRTTLTRTLRPLEEAGYVASSAGDDHRTRIVEITGCAKTAMRRAHSYWRDAQARVEAVVGYDRKALFEVLDRIETMS